MNELVALFWFVLIVGLVIVVGLVVGILVGRRIDQVVARREEAHDPDDGGPRPAS